MGIFAEPRRERHVSLLCSLASSLQFAEVEKPADAVSA